MNNNAQPGLPLNTSYTAHQITSNGTSFGGGFRDSVQSMIVQDKCSRSFSPPSFTPIKHERQQPKASTTNAQQTSPTPPSPSLSPTTTSGDSNPLLTNVVENLRQMRDAAFSHSRSDGFTRFRSPHPHERDLSAQGNRSFFTAEGNQVRGSVRNTRARFRRGPQLRAKPTWQHIGRG